MTEGFSDDARPLRNAAVPAGSGGEVLAPDLYLPTGAVRSRHAHPFCGTRKTRSHRIENHESFRFFASHGSRRCWSTCEVTEASGGDPRRAFDPGEADDGVTAVE